MSPEGFEPRNPASERRKTEVLYSDATGMADIGSLKCKYRLLHLQEAIVLLVRYWLVCIQNPTAELNA